MHHARPLPSAATSLLAALALALVASFAPASLAAQSCDADNEYMELVRQQAVNAGEIFAESGYAVEDMLCGSLSEGEEDWLDVQMEAGDRIAFVAVCDQDCSDIDLALYAGDMLIAEDILEDDVPILEIGPAVSGPRYQLKVTMYECSTEPCFFGVAMFASGG